MLRYPVHVCGPQHRQPHAGQNRAMSSWFARVPVLFALLVGCEPADDPATAKADAGSVSDDAAVWVPVDPHACKERCGNGQMYVLDYVTVLAADSSGVAPGFDLDGLQSKASDEGSCGFDDLTNQYGDSGVDNQYAFVARVLPSQVADTLPGALATSIATGGMSLLLEEVGPQGVAEGAAPNALVIRKGTGQPLLGTDGKILEDQSFALEPQPVLGVADFLSWDGSGVRTGPFTFQFKMLFVDKNLSFTFHKARLRYGPDGKGGIVGELGGIVTMQELNGLLGFLGGCDQPLREQLEALVPGFADITLDPAEPCGAFSMGFSFHGVQAHLQQSAQ